MPISAPEGLLVDGHVHVHPRYEVDRFLSQASENLRRHGPGLPTLLLTEMRDAHVFAQWKAGNCPWSTRATGESESLLLDEKLLVIAGRQIVTRERVEVHALLTDELFEDGRSFEDTLAAVRASPKAIASLPWGVGKWIGSRFRFIRKAVADPDLVLLGDNAGRPIGWPEPSLFRTNVVLPGSDPLRPRREQAVVGTYGFRMEGPVNTERPAAFLRTALRGTTKSPERFGSRAGPWNFLRQQISLRVAK